MTFDWVRELDYFTEFFLRSPFYVVHVLKISLYFQAQAIHDLCSHHPTLDDYVRGALREVMSNSLATEFNWFGKNGKANFSMQFFAKLLPCK